MAEKPVSTQVDRNFRVEFLNAVRSQKLIQVGFRDKDGRPGGTYRHDYAEPESTAILALDVGEVLDLVPGNSFGTVGVTIKDLLTDLGLGIAIQQGDEDPADWGPET